MSHDLKNHVQSIADTLSNGFDLSSINDDGEYTTAFDYLQDALDIEYIVNGKGEYLGARVLVAFGGPNIWVNTSYPQTLVSLEFNHVSRSQKPRSIHRRYIV